MATGTLSPDPYLTVLDANGKPVSGAKINTYIAGTTTPQATYTDVTLGTPNTNPIIADTAGRYVAYLTLGASYKYVITDSGGASIRTQDNISAIPGSSAGLDLTGVAGETLTAGQAVYLSDGSGGKTAGLWYKADSGNGYSSTTPEIGMVPATIASGSSGTIRQAGQVTGLTSLTVGTTYYVGLAGAVTSTPPANVRVVGVADTTSSLVLGAPVPNVVINNAVAQGRLTLTTAVPVTTADVLAATTLRYAPYAGNIIALYTGTNWALFTFPELSIAVPATTSQMYDVFVFDNSGTRTLELLAWTNDTTRATALVTQDGVLCKTGVLTRRYVGSFRTTTVSGQTEDSFAKRYVWNYTNRVARELRNVAETTDSWTYTTAAFRQANANTANQLDLVVGVAEVAATMQVQATVANSAGGVFFSVGIGIDSTTVQGTGVLNNSITSGASQHTTLGATLRTYPPIGRHFYPWLEISAATPTTTWFGDDTAGSPQQSGISGEYFG